MPRLVEIVKRSPRCPYAATLALGKRALADLDVSDEAVPPQALRAFLDRVPDTTLVVLDEAYFEYARRVGCTAGSTLLARHPNLVVLRTFSKAQALAGVRVGYALSHSDVANLLNRVRQPFNVSSLGLAAATAALDDMEFVAGLWCAVEAQDFDRESRRSGVDVLAAVVDQATDAAPDGAGNQHVADLQGAFLDQHGGDRAAARLKLGLDHDAVGGAVGIGLHFRPELAGRLVRHFHGGFPATGRRALARPMTEFNPLNRTRRK